MTSKPSSASGGSTARTPSKPPQERGKSSYHAPKRASGRSTSTWSVSDQAFPNRSSERSASASSIVKVSRPSMASSSASSLVRSVSPAPSLRLSSSWNEATRSTHASMRYDQPPQRSTRNDPDHSSLPSEASGSLSQRVTPAGL